eukprot:CAMPEP_0176033656 /NCGR_PEP_ID=MMETSP0120_2-20121206/16626_1 /TAXON_ID=160619 /ORGANISM="Kryptoperidinium foliaceum, Strain CCMP 1326" /LENGTH=526 /DNA_ID=CAMNT_0017366985 /DNA_START=23 /DNA_END=1600 /DNA_ORIENTATION=-
MGNEALRPGDGLRAEVLSTIGGCSTSARVMFHLYDAGTVKQPLLRSVAWNLGLSPFHCTVEVHGIEWSFCERGVFWCRAGIDRQLDVGLVRQRSQLLGETSKSGEQVLMEMQKLSRRWLGCSFHGRTHNSGHFCKEVCERLDVGPFPPWAAKLIQDASRLGWTMCCTEYVSGTFTVVESGDGRLLEGKSEAHAMEFAMPPEFEQWCDDYVSSLQHERAIPPPLPTPSWRPSECARPWGASTPRSGMLYHLVRERWLRAKRGKGPRTSAYSVHPLQHVCEVPAFEEDGAFEEHHANRMLFGGGAAGDGDQGSSVTKRICVTARFDERGGLGVEVGPGRPVVVSWVDPQRPELEDVNIGDVVDIVAGARILCREDFDAALERSATVGEESMLVTLTRLPGAACSTCSTADGELSPSWSVDLALLEAERFADPFTEEPNVEGLASFLQWIDGYVDAFGERHAMSQGPRSSSRERGLLAEEAPSEDRIGPRGARCLSPRQESFASRLLNSRRFSSGGQQKREIEVCGGAL